VGSRKGRQLLKLLAARRDRATPVDEVAEALWPGEPPARFEQNVASLVSRLRGVLGAGAIAGDRNGYRLGTGVDVDLEQASRLSVESASRLAQGEPALAVAAASRAVAMLSSGEALEGEPDAPWVDDVRTAAGRQLRDALRCEWRAALAAGDLETARASASVALEADPLDEQAVRALMTAHHRAGNDAAALQAYEALREALADELGADPSPETREVHLTVLRGGDPEAPDDSGSAAPASAAAAVAAGGPDFVGRDRELGELSDAWSGAADRRPSLVLLVGEAGIGKSRLAEELVRLAARTGGFVARARCFEAERSLFLQPVADAIRPVATGLPPDALRRVVGDQAGALGAVVPEVATILRPHGYQPADAEIERRRAFDAVRAFLVELGEVAPVLLFLDDLHNAGSSTLELLHFLARRASRARVLILATVRVEEGGDALEHLEGMGRRIEVGQLSPDDVSELARRAGAGEHSERLLAATNGHTLSVVECLRVLAETPAGGGPDVPPSLADAVLSRVRRMGPEVEDLLHVASILGSTFEPDAAAGMLDLPFEECVRRIEVARRGRVVVVAGTAWAFANDLIREILYRDTPEPTRRARHRRAASLSTENPEAVAAHASAAGDWDEAAAAWLEAGLRAAARYANRDARRMFDGAIDAAERAGDGRTAAAARLERGRVREALADFDGAYQDQVAALTGARASGDRRLEMWVLRELGGDPLVGLGRSASECVPHLESALRIAEDIGDAAAEVDIRSRLAILSVNRLRFREAREQAERAVRVARGLGDDGVLASALDGLKTAIAYDGDVAQLEAITPEVERLARASGRLKILQWAVFESSFPPMARGRWGPAALRVREALELTRRLGFSGHVSMFLAHIGWIERSQGHYAQALAVGRQSLLQAEEADHPWWASFTAGMLGWTLTDLGAADEAVRILEAGLLAAKRDGTELYLVRCLAHLALARASAGDAAGALADLEGAERILVHASNPPESRFLHGAHATLAAARAALLLGSPERAAALAGPVRQSAEECGWVEPHTEAALVLAGSHLLQGSLEEAESNATTAVDLAERTGLWRLAWEARAALAHVLDARGRAEAADEQRVAAHATAAAVAGPLGDDDRARFLARAGAAIAAVDPAPS
jgi:DNA-binding SARP family transcriptional activator